MLLLRIPTVENSSAHRRRFARCNGHPILWAMQPLSTPPYHRVDLRLRALCTYSSSCNLPTCPLRPAPWPARSRAAGYRGSRGAARRSGGGGSGGGRRRSLRASYIPSRTPHHTTAGLSHALARIYSYFQFSIRGKCARDNVPAVPRRSAVSGAASGHAASISCIKRSHLDRPCTSASGGLLNAASRSRALQRAACLASRGAMVRPARAAFLPARCSRALPRLRRRRRSPSTASPTGAYCGRADWPGTGRDRAAPPCARVSLRPWPRFPK